MPDKDCPDFASQAAAQAVLRANPSDPNGLDGHSGPADGNDQAGGDGIACESNPPPHDLRPVFANSGNGSTTQTTTVTGGNALPMTGAHTEPVAIGGSIVLLLGVAMVLIGRRRTVRR